MSYVRFSEGDAYVFTSKHALECCGCLLQKRQWVDDHASPLGGFLKPVGRRVRTQFRSNRAMVNHLRRHQRAGHYIPDHVFTRLEDPEDAKENQRIWKHK